jgi:hypothetical protein
MTHGVFVVGVLLLALNDHVLKAAWPGWWTGKLSDAAGMVFFPLLLQSVWELATQAAGRWKGHRLGVTTACVVLTGTVFTLVKTIPQAAHAYRVTWGVLRWPLELGSACWHNQSVPTLGRVQLTMDASDVLVLPFLALALWVGWRASTAPVMGDPA